jgi:hypothetical protein
VTTLSRVPASLALALGALALVVGGVPTTARGATRFEAKTGVGLHETYDSNVFNRRTSQDTDFYTALVPEAGFRFRGDRGNGIARFGVRSRFYNQYNELNGTDRFATYGLEYMLRQRLQVFSNGSYTFNDKTDVVDSGGVQIGGGNPESEQGFASGGVRYTLSRRETLSLSGNYSRYKFDDDFASSSRRQDFSSMGSSLKYERRISLRDSATLGTTLVETKFDGSLNQPESKSRVVSLDTGWTHVWTPSWKSSTTVGVRRVFSDLVTSTAFVPLPGQRPVNTNPDDTSDSFIGSLMVERTGKYSNLAVGYSRETRPSSGIGTELDIDQFTAGLRYRLASRWTFIANGAWSRSQSATEQVVTAFLNPSFNSLVCLANNGVVGTLPNPIDPTTLAPACALNSNSAVDTTMRQYEIGLDWQMRERWTTFLRYRYRDESSSGDIQIRDFDKHLVTLGVRFNYDVDLF